MASSCYLDYEGFQDSIRCIVAISDGLGDEWRLLTSKTTERLYMVRKTILCSLANDTSLAVNDVALADSIDVSIEDDGDIEHEDEDANCSTVSIAMKPSGCISCEYHVVYSSSYEIPVLYFNMHTTDGRLLTLDQIWKLVPHQQHERLEGNLWSLVTQSEHPILGRPFYQIHPCHTAKMMAKLLSNRSSSTGNNYVLTWLSAVGSMVGLTVSPSYFLHQHA